VRVGQEVDPGSAGWVTVLCRTSCRVKSCRVGYRVGWDIVPGGISCRAGYCAGRDIVPRGMACHAGYRAWWGTVALRALR
jgi:hypothetical protein